MLGRAGRLGFHDKGKVYLLVEPGRKIFVGQKETEEQIAFELLTKPVEDVDPILDVVQEEEEVLATVVSFGKVNISKDKMIFANILGRTTPLKGVVSSLRKMKMITIENKNISPTTLGKAVALSFLSPSYALRLIQAIERQQKKGFDEDFALDLAVQIHPFRSAHLSAKVHGEIERVLKSTISTNIFSGTVLELYSGNSWGRKNPTKLILETFAIWTKKIFTCNCSDKPFCDCGLITFSKILFRLRREGNSPTRVAKIMREENNIQLYPGDIYSWLDTLVHSLEAIQRLASVINAKELSKLARRCTKQIEKPK
ncbi:MAG: DUF5814 domain-containing protein, partial [Candidatus Heimdallarchaeaceae archaeon]